MKYDHIPKSERCLSPKDLLVRLGAMAYESFTVLGLALTGQSGEKTLQATQREAIQQIEDYANTPQ